MRKNKLVNVRIWPFAFILLVLSLAVACGAQSATIDQVPTYPGAVTIQQGENNMADSVVTAMTQSAGQQALNAQFQLFSLPAGTTWDDVRNFYNQELPSLNWKQEQAMTVDGEGFQAVGWSHGTGNNQQALMIGYVPDVGGDGAFAIVGLFSK